MTNPIISARRLGGVGVVLLIGGTVLVPDGTDVRPPKPNSFSETPCAEAPASELRPSRNLYCMDLVPSPGLSGIQAMAELARVPSPFGVRVTADGHHEYDVSFIVSGLPSPQSLGAYTTFVAWVTTPLLYPVIKLGEVGNGTTQLAPISLDKFLLLVSAEPSGDVSERTGRLVLRGLSPSTRRQPADLFEFLLGASRPADTTGAPQNPDGMRMSVGGDPASWVRPPMPQGVQMLQALMDLDPPSVTPYLPGMNVGDVSSMAAARPRELVMMSDGDTLDLEAVFVRRTIRGKQFTMYGFNGQYPGPLIWAPQNATVIVNFTNRIDWPTTVHWHGVRLQNEFDGVPGVTQDPVLPGESFQYRIHFRDAGIYWYHPHYREDIQQDLGLYGNMMVRSPRTDYFTPANREEVLILDDLLMNGDRIVPYGRERSTHTLMGRFGNLFLLNGEPDYELSVNQGDVVRFFLTNVSNTRTFNLSFGRAAIKVVGSDVGNFEREEWAESVVIAPAERYIVHVRFPGSDDFVIENRVQGIDHLNGTFFPEVDTLGFIRASRDAASPDHSASFETLREDTTIVSEIDEYRPFFSRPVDRELILTMEAEGFPFVVDRLMRFDSTYFNPVEWSGTMPMMNWIATPEEAKWILRDPATGNENMDIEWQFDVGEVVKVRLSNRREAFHAMQHPIHIHGQRFLVLEQNGVPSTNLVWKDTMLLPVGSTSDILLEITNPGRWMVHCHIAEHLESGMMMAFTVN